MASDRDPDVAVGAPIPPPIVLFAAILAGFGLGHFVPLPIPISRAVADVAGGFLLAIGIAVGLASARTLVAGGSTPLPHRPTRALVGSGIYRFSRNPIYLSMAVLLAAIALPARSGWRQ